MWVGLIERVLKALNIFPPPSCHCYFHVFPFLHKSIPELSASGNSHTVSFLVYAAGSLPDAGKQ